MRLFETVLDLQQGEPVIRRRRYGVVETCEGQLNKICLRPWPKLISVSDQWWGQGVTHHRTADRCLLYYNQPLRYPSFLALKFVVSSFGTRFATFRRALLVLDEIARIKQSDALLCEVRSHRISDRLLKRWGWQRHVLGSRRRHFIKRLYPSSPAVSGRKLNALLDLSLAQQNSPRSSNSRVVRS